MSSPISAFTFQLSAFLPSLPLRLCAFARGNLYTPAPFTTAASLPIHSSWLRVFSRKDEKAKSFSESKNPDSFGKTVYRCFGASVLRCFGERERISRSHRVFRFSCTDSPKHRAAKRGTRVHSSGVFSYFSFLILFSEQEHTEVGQSEDLKDVPLSSLS